jgi:uncharacterized protein (DUF433 family)
MPSMRPIIIHDPKVNKGHLSFASSGAQVEDVINKLKQSKRPNATRIAEEFSLPLEDLQLFMEANGFPLSQKVKKNLHTPQNLYGPESDKVDALLNLIGHLSPEEAEEISTAWDQVDKTQLKPARLRLHALAVENDRVKICADTRDAAYKHVRQTRFPRWWHGEPLANMAEALAMSDVLDRNDWHLLTGRSVYPMFLKQITLDSLWPV